jgi:hypothetical protein
MRKKKPYDGKYGPAIDLRAIEEESLAEGRDWVKRRIEEKLRERTAVFSPCGGEGAPECPAPEAEA